MASNLYPPSVYTLCDLCGEYKKRQGYGRHRKACVQKAERDRQNREFEATLEAEVQAAEQAAQAMQRDLVAVPPRSRPMARLVSPHMNFGDSSRAEQITGGPYHDDPPPSPEAHLPSPEARLPSPEAQPPSPMPYSVDDIRTEYHPNSQRETHVDSFETYGRKSASPPQVVNPKPWLPFRSRAEFTFAEIALETAMSNSQLDSLIKVVHTLIKGKEVFELKNHKDVQNLWDRASEDLTPFSKHDISVSYKGLEKPPFEFWCRPLWGWMMNLLEDPQLAPLFEWDAKKLSKFDGTSWKSFVDEPWTAKRFWKVQSELPPGAKPLCITLYADKTKLSSFGTSQGYPIMAQCANLPRTTRNGKGLGATQVVGWLPVIAEDEAEKGKPGYVNFKRAVWHESFKILLETISKHSFTGCWVKCGDGIMRHLYPFIFILSADYEEQCVMALIRGAKGLYPCPVCLVPAHEQSDFTKRFPARTAEHTQKIYKEGLDLSAAEREELLKSEGIRNVENAFWTVQNSDPHDALSWDHMHNYAHGLGGKHIWPAIKRHVTALGRPALTLVDLQNAALPRWRNLNHFNKIMSLTFSDANKYEDILKMIPFTTHNILTKKDSPLGYAMLRCLRSYLKMDMWVSMEVHTEDTIKEGQKELERFSVLIKEYIEAQAAFADVTVDIDDAPEPDDPDETPLQVKDFNFPKAHSQAHIFDNILDKGATYIYSTKLFERLHGPLKKWYSLRTNFKNVAPQILRAEHHTLTSILIRSQITVLEDSESVEGDEVDNPTGDSGQKARETTGEFGNVYLGSAQKPCRIRDLQNDQDSTSPFHRF